MKKQIRPAPKFAVGSQVRVSDRASFNRGVIGTVKRVFWESAGGGQAAGWVCELSPGHTFWERLLDQA